MEKRNKKIIILLSGALLMILLITAIINITKIKEMFVEKKQAADISKLISVNGTYKDGVSKDGEREVQFEYSDKMLLSGAGSGVNGDLAKVSVVLASAAYSETNVTSALKHMGYETESYQYDLNLTYEDNDHVAFTVGHHKADDYTFYILPVRGTGGNAEWYSNFNLGTNGEYHEGFYKASKEVLNTLYRHFEADGSDPQHRIILVTGHSRGAAVANIIAGTLTDTASYVDPSNVYGYTFACPAVSKNADTNYKNIINYNASGDVIPELPLSSWGYKRYGQTLSLSDAVDEKKNFEKRFIDVTKREFAGADSTEYFVDTLQNLVTDDKDFNDDLKHCAFELVADYLGEKSWESVPKILEAHGRFLIPKLAIKLTSSVNPLSFLLQIEEVADEWKDLQKRIQDGINKTKGMNEDEWQVWFSDNQALMNEIYSETDVIIKNKVDLTLASIQIASNLESAKGILDIGTDILLLFLDTEGNLIGAIEDAHTSDNYVLNINTMYYGDQGWYDNDFVKVLDMNSNGVVTTIGKQCFYGCDQLQTVILPDELEKAGNFAFAYSGLSCPIISSTITELGESCFANTQIKSFKMSGGMTEIAVGVCNSCTSLEEVLIPDSVSILGQGAFSQCGEIDKIAMPSDITYAAWSSVSSNYNTFYGTSAKEIHFTKGQTGEMPDYVGDMTNSLQSYSQSVLEKVVIDEGVTKIGANAFYDCVNLKQVNLPQNVKSVGNHAFSNVKGLGGTTELPKVLRKVGEHAFQGSNLSCPVTSEENMELGTYCFADTQIPRIEFAEGTVEIPEGVCSNCTSLKTVVVPDSVSTIGSTAFRGCGEMDKITLPSDVIYGAWSSISSDYNTFYGTSTKEIHFTKGQTGEMPDYEGDMTNSLQSYSRSVLEKVVIDEGVTKIGASAFYDCVNLKQVNLPQNVKSVGNYAFSNVKGLGETTELPKVLRKVGDHAFQGSNLSCPVTSEENMELGTYCFADTQIPRIEFAEGTVEIPEGVCSNCTSLKTVVVPDSVNTIGSTAFRGCGEMDKITLPSDVIYGAWSSISSDYNTFYGTSTKEIHFTKGQTGEMPDYVGDMPNSLQSYSQSVLEKVVIDEGVTKIGANAFYDCVNLKQVNLPQSVKSVGNNAFSNVKGLGGTTELPKALRKVGEYAFRGSNLSCPVTSKENMELGIYCFADTQIPRIEFAEGTVEIPEGVCSNCTSLKTVVVPDSVSTIGPTAFRGCGEMDKITLPSDVIYGAWSSVSSDSNTFYGTSTKAIHFTKGQTGEMPDYEGDMTNSLQSYSQSVLEKVVIDDGVVRIGANAFKDCRNLKKVSFPSSITSIGDNSIRGTSEALYVFGTKDSYAEEYTKTADRTFIPYRYPVITPESVTMNTGEKQQFEAVIFTDMDTTSRDVEWNVSDAHSEGTKITKEGLLSVAEDENASVIHVNAESGSFKATVSITLESRPSAYEVMVKNPEESHITRDTDTGEELQEVKDKLQDIVYYADAGYYFPLDYSVPSVNGIEVARNSATQITVFGTPTGNVEITLTEAVPKINQEAPEGLTDGVEQIMGTTGAMEYAGAADSTEWISCTENSTEVAAGVWYVRYKADEFKNAGEIAEITITAKKYELTASSVEFDFGNGLEDSQERAEAQIATITNSGNQTVTLIQPEAVNFEIGEISKLVVAPDETVSFTIQPAEGLKTGIYNETLIIETENKIQTAIELKYSVLGSLEITVQGETEIVRGESTTLTAQCTGGDDNYSYQWYITQVSDETFLAATESITVEPTESTLYIVEVVDGSGQQAKATVTVTVNYSAVEVQPSNLDFGSKTEGYAQSPDGQYITVQNIGNRDETLVLPDSEFYEISISLTVITPGETSTIQVQPKTGLKPGSYHELYEIATENGAGSSVNLSFQVNEEIKIIVNPLKILKAEPNGKQRVQLNWTAVKDAHGYLVYGQKKGKYGYVGMTSRTSFVDTKALDEEYNFYWVFPYIKNSEGKMVTGACTKYVYAKGICPAVTNLRASSSNGGVGLSWTKSSGAEGYLIYGKTASGKYGYIGMTTKGTTYTDRKAPKTEYKFYWVFPYHRNASGKMIAGGTAKYVWGKAK